MQRYRSVGQQRKVSQIAEPTSMPSPGPAEVMDITTMLNNKGSVHHQFSLDHHHHHHHLIKPDPIMERSASPHGSEHSHYSTSHSMSRAYPSPTAMQAPLHIPNPMSSAMQMPNFPDMHGMANMSALPLQQMPQQSQSPQQPVKAYPCSTCGKGFARRSDLARHDRTSAIILIVGSNSSSGQPLPSTRESTRVRSRIIARLVQRYGGPATRSKPTLQLLTCTSQPFSDSSSLARHRRTHSGKRPYKCPYADCQKTFTRRTTLTRHQNHHSGTIEEAAAATAAALAASKSKVVGQARSESDHMSSHGSPLMTTPSPAQRTMSMSPSMDLSGANGIPRHAGDFQYLSQNSPLPPHLRVGSPSSTTSAAYNTAMRPTSHPTSYGPPPTLEPSLEPHQSGLGSAGGSPHMSSVGWHSPSHMPSPAQHAGNYVYPEPDAYPQSAAAMGQMYFGAAPQMRRPQSAEAGLVHMA
ncbi:zinc finger protein [Paramyrothecium foliicola]|nr:zinc finger protein [Paramyrothecium foliicola]